MRFNSNIFHHRKFKNRYTESNYFHSRLLSLLNCDTETENEGERGGEERGGERGEEGGEVLKKGKRPCVPYIYDKIWKTDEFMSHSFMIIFQVFFFDFDFCVFFFDVFVFCFLFSLLFILYSLFFFLFSFFFSF